VRDTFTGGLEPSDNGPELELATIPEIVALRNALQPASLVDTAKLRSLRPVVDAAVDTLKGRGFPPERMLIAIKAVAQNAGLRPTALEHVDVESPELLAVNRLFDAIVIWAIARYFEK
jgi:hypothetical protein